MYQKLLAFALLLALAAPMFAQTPTAQKTKSDPAELRKEAVAFLRETMGDVQNMRTLENRISFSAELAGLMWFHDEQEAKSMFNTAISDFRELIARLDAQMMALPDETDSDSEESIGAIMPFMDGSDRRKLEMKYRVAMAVRQQIATSIAEHDPDIALSFFYDTASSNPKTASLGGRDTTFEVNLLKEIALKSPSKASQYGIKTLEKGFDYQHVDLLRKIHYKDPEIAVEFGSAILKKVKDTKFKSYEIYALGSLMDLGETSLDASREPNGKKPVYSQNDMRELAEVLAKHMLETENPEVGSSYLTRIEKYAPARAAQVRAKLNRGDASKGSNRSSGLTNVAVATAPPPDHEGPIIDTVGSASNSNAGSAREKEQEAKRQAEEKLMTDVQKIGKGELPKEERDKVIAQSRKILMQNKGKDKQITGLSMLATQVAKAGDKDLAAEIMRDAEALVNPQPKHYQDFMYTWLLVTGYAEADPEKAFPILESAIGRANDLINAFMKVGEFIDVSEEMISDGEAQVGAFGGGMIRGLSRELGVAEATLGTLIKADFAKTRAMTNRFDRPEVRILAKMLVLRTALGKKPEASAEEQVKKAMGQN